MSILCNLSIGLPLCRAQLWMFQQLTASDHVIGDIRMAIVALLSLLLTAAWKNTAARACQGARFVRRVTAADIMVAAARG